MNLDKVNRIIACCPIDQLEDILQNLETEEQIYVLTYLKISPRTFKKLSETYKNLFIEHNIYLHHNFGVMQNYVLNDDNFTNIEQKRTVYSRLVKECLDTNQLSYLYSTPLNFYYYTLDNPEVYQKIDINDYFKNVLVHPNKKQVKEMMRSYSYLLFDWMASIDQLDINIIYECINNAFRAYPNNKYFSYKKETLQTLFNKIYKIMVKDETVNFDTLYSFFNPIMTIQQERECLKNFVDKEIIFNAYKLPHKPENADIIKQIRFYQNIKGR